MNPGTLPLWLAGLLWLLGSREGRRYRAIGITYLITLAEFIILHGKSYYLAPAYPMLFAAGGVAVERIFASHLKWLKPALLGAMLVTGALICTIGRADFAARQTCRIHASHSLPTATHRDIAYGRAAAGFRRPVWLGTNGWLGRTRLSSLASRG